MVELTNQLWEGRFSWLDWERAKTSSKTIVDEHEPIVTGGIRLLALEGLLLNPDAKYLSPTREELRDEQRAAWKRLIRTKSREHLARVAPAIIGGRRVFGGTAMEEGKNILSELRNIHIADIRYVQERARCVDDAKMLRKDLADPRMEQLKIAELGQGDPPLSERLDAAVRFSLYKYRLALKPRHPYNPESGRNRNDSIDRGLLDYLALPALVCTADGNLIEDVRLAGSWQDRWMIDVRFADSLERAAPPDMNWPSHSPRRAAAR